MLIATLFLICAVVPIQAQDKKPNIILIVSDDFGYGNAGVDGGGRTTYENNPARDFTNETKR